MRKRLLALCLTLSLLVGQLPTTALATGGTVWTEIVTEQPPGYTVGNSGNVTISSAEGLAWFARQVNTGVPFSGKIITLSGDIDLSAHEWVPIGTQAHPFDGTFDGNGNTISGMDVVVSTDSPAAGLFGIVSECMIKNTTLVGAQITGTVVGPEEPNDNDWETANDYLDTMIGGIVAANKKASSSSNTVTIQGCDVKNLTVDLTTSCGVDVSIGGILGKTDDFSSSQAGIINCNADIAVTYRSDTDDNRTYIGGAIGELCSPKQTNILENGNYTLKVTIPQNAPELVEFRYSIGGAIGYMGTFSNSLVDPIVKLRDISCHSTLDFSRTNGILPNSIPFFEANFTAGGIIGRGSDFHMDRCFAMIDLFGPESEKPTGFGNLVGFTQNTDTITCDKVYTYAIGYQGANTYYENEECASNINWSDAKNIKDLYYIERQTLTVNQAGAPFLYQIFSDEYSITEDLNDTVIYTDGKEDDITVSPTEEGTQVIVDKATDACYVYGKLTLDEGFAVAFTLPISVEGVSSPAYTITTEVNDLTNPGVWTNCKVITEPVEKAKAGELVTITAKPFPSGTKLVDSVTVTTEDGTPVNVKKTDGNVTGNQTYTFTMPSSNVTVTGVFRAISTEFTLSPSTVTFDVYEGYTAEDVEPQTVTITNTGDKDVTFEGSYALPTSTYYEIQPDEGNWDGTTGREITIAPGETATFTVAPKPGLTGATNPNTIKPLFYSTEKERVYLTLQCNVTQAPVYSLTANPTTLSFGELYEGYTAPSGQAVMLTNTGTGTLNVTLPTSEHFTVTPDTSLNNGTVSLAPNGTTTVTVTPKQGLTAGTYPETLSFITDRDGVKADVAVSVTVVPHENITITPADITIYSGGDSYSGIVNDSGVSSQTTGFPEPGYYITLPDDLNDLLGGAGYAADLSGKLTLNFKDHDNAVADRTWELELYGEGESSAEIEIDGVKRECYIYQIKPAQVGEEEIPAHLEVIDAEGNIIESDVFTPESDQQHMDYTIRFCTEGLDLKDLTFKLVIKDETTGQETTYTRGVTLGTGSLVVRGVMDGLEAIREIADAPEKITTSGKIAAVAPSDVTYYVNDSNVAVADPAGVRLLADSLIDDEEASQAMLNYIKSDSNDLNIPTTENTRIQAKYMDLVDSKNGNAYLTMGDGQKMLIYWPVPADFDVGTTAYVVHFDALDRDYDNASDALINNPPEQIELGTPVTINGAQYFTFKTSTFSPFVLVYEKESGGGGTTKYYTLQYDTNGGNPIQSETKSFVWIKAYNNLPVPTRNGFIFDGWYLDSALTELVKGDVKVDHDTVTLYAGWHEDVSDPDDTGVSDWLNTKDHFSYLHGYETGTFYPEREMTRAEAAQIFYNVLLNQNVPITVSFSDVPEDAWYADAVNTLASLGFIKGIGANRFNPERSITRAEFTAIAMRFTNGGQLGENIFSDIDEEDWYYEPVVRSIQYGWIKGYEDGTFHPNHTISRAEVTAVANRMLGRSADKTYINQNIEDLHLFPDVDRDYWAFYHIVEATNGHEYTKHDGLETWDKLGA